MLCQFFIFPLYPRKMLTNVCEKSQLLKGGTERPHGHHASKEVGGAVVALCHRANKRASTSK